MLFAGSRVGRLPFCNRLRNGCVAGEQFGLKCRNLGLDHIVEAHATTFLEAGIVCLQSVTEDRAALRIERWILRLRFAPEP